MPSVAQLDIPYNDFNDLFQEQAWYFVDRVHLTDLGYTKFSEILSSKKFSELDNNKKSLNL